MVDSDREWTAKQFAQSFDDSVKRIMTNAVRYDNAMAILRHWLAGHDLGINEQNNGAFWSVDTFKSGGDPVEFDTFEQALHYALNKVSRVDDAPPA